MEAAQRELFEESGLKAELLIQVAQIVVDTGTNPGILFYVFKAKQLSGNLRESEEGRLAWFSQKEALKLDLVEDLYTLLPMAMRHRRHEKPWFGHYSYDDEDQLLMRFSR